MERYNESKGEEGENRLENSSVQRNDVRTLQTSSLNHFSKSNAELLKSHAALPSPNPANARRCFLQTSKHET